MKLKPKIFLQACEYLRLRHPDDEGLCWAITKAVMEDNGCPVEEVDNRVSQGDFESLGINQYQAFMKSWFQPDMGVDECDGWVGFFWPWLQSPEATETNAVEPRMFALTFLAMMCEEENRKKKKAT